MTTQAILGLAAFFIFVSVGLHRRAVWMWYLGWFWLYVVAARFGYYSFQLVEFAETSSQVWFAHVMLVGGFLFCVPFALLWGKWKRRFNRPF